MYEIKNKLICSGTFGYVHELKVIQNNSPDHSEIIHVEAMKFFTDVNKLSTAVNEMTILRQLRGLSNVVQIKQFCHVDIKKTGPSSFLNKLSLAENPIVDNSIRPHVICNLFNSGPTMIITMDCYQTDLLSLRKLVFSTRYEQFAQTNIDFLAAGIARGLNLLRHHRIVHGDIKMNNILVNYTALSATKEQQNIVFTDVRICDFNISLMLPMSRALESVLCINRKLSPKIVRAPELSFDILQSQKSKIDIWNYGCLLYEFMTNRFLFSQGFKKAYWSYFSRGINVVYEEEPSELLRPEKKIKLETPSLLQNVKDLRSDLDTILVNVPRDANEHFSVTTTQKIQIYQTSYNKILFKEENAKILDICLGCLEINPMWRITPDIILKKLNITVDDNNPITTSPMPEFVQLTDEHTKSIFEAKKIIAGYISCNSSTHVKIFVHFECILDRYKRFGSAKQIDRNLALACLFIAHSFDFARDINNLLNHEIKSDTSHVYEIICDILDSKCDLISIDETRVLKYINYVCTESIKAQENKKDIKFVDMFVDISTGALF